MKGPDLMRRRIVGAIGALLVGSTLGVIDPAAAQGDPAGQGATASIHPIRDPGATAPGQPAQAAAATSAPVAPGLATPQPSVQRRVNTTIDFRDPKVLVTVQAGEPIRDPESFVQLYACPQLLGMHVLDGLPVPYMLQVLVRTTAGTWRPDPRQRVEGLLRQCN